MPQSEKRKYVRQPCSDKFFIESAAPDQHRIPLKPIYLRDVSDGGISGTYFGDDIPKRDDVLFIKSTQGETKPVRLVWAVRSVEAVYMLGFRYEGDHNYVCAS